MGSGSSSSTFASKAPRASLIQPIHVKNLAGISSDSRPRREAKSLMHRLRGADEQAEPPGQKNRRSGKARIRRPFGIYMLTTVYIDVSLFT